MSQSPGVINSSLQREMSRSQGSINSSLRRDVSISKDYKLVRCGKRLCSEPFWLSGKALGW